MASNTSGKIAGAVFGIIIPTVVSLMIPSIGWGIGGAIITVSLALAFADLVLLVTPKRRERLITVALVVVGTLLLGGGITHALLLRQRETAAPSGSGTLTKILFECNIVSLPSVIPSSGLYPELKLWRVPIDNFAGGIIVRQSLPGSELFPPGDVPMGYHCAVRNYGPTTLIKVQIVLNVQFQEAVPTVPGGYNSGEVVFQRPWLVEIPRLDAGPDHPFEFYVSTDEPLFVTAYVPSEATAQRIDKDARESFPLVHDTPRGLTVGPVFPSPPAAPKWRQSRRSIAAKKQL